MQLTGGHLKGRKIEVIKTVRPTLSKIRECVFNSLNSRYNGQDNLTFLDLFAGSGLMGLEAYSRNYIVTSIEKDPVIAKNIRKNFNNVGAKCTLHVFDCMKFLKKTEEKFDVIYIDPPWTDRFFNYTNEEIILNAQRALKKDGIIILEYQKNKKPHSLNQTDKWLIGVKTFGRCELKFYASSSFSNEELLNNDIL